MQLVRNRLLASAAAVVLAASLAGGARAAAVVDDADLGDLSLDQLMGITVTSASKKEQRADEVASAIFVLTQEDIRRSGATSIPEVLRLVPGLNVSQATPNSWAVTARGFNGRFAPHHKVAPARYRLRLLNSSAFSSYNLTLSDGRPFVQLGTGDGLLPAPVVRQSILLGPAQRADVIVDFNGESGQNVVLQTVPRTDSETGTGSRIGQLMQFRVRGKARDMTSIPTRRPASSPETNEADSSTDGRSCS